MHKLGVGATSIATEWPGRVTTVHIKYFSVVTRSGSAHVSQNIHVPGYVHAAVPRKFWGMVGGDI